MSGPDRAASWVALSVDRPVGTIMAVLAVIVFGWVSLAQLPVTLLPDVSHPTVTVRVTYDGAAPEEVEKDVLEPIEELAGTAEGVVAIESIARAGGGDVLLRFAWRTDLDTATQRVRERLALVELPDGIPTPRVLRYDPALDPVIRLALSGDLGADALRTLAIDEVERELERVEGVAAVRVLGGAEAVVQVALDEQRLSTLGLTAAEVADRLGSENVNVAGGVLAEGDIEYLVRTLNEFTTLEELGSLPVRSSGDRVVRLRDIATITRTVREPTELTTVDGRSSVEIAVFKEADANLVAVAEAVKTAMWGPRWRSVIENGAEAAASWGADGSGAVGEEVAEAPARAASFVDDLPDGAELSVLSDQSRYVRSAIAEVNSTAIQGAFWATLVVLVFLRNLWATSIIAIAIPLSIVATFAAMRILGLSLNVMSLGGLALGIGMLVDNSIVVLEAIVRRREGGATARDAAVAGAGDVGMAVVASTMTTVAVFAPIAFVEGVAGELFGDLALTVVLSLLASLVVSLLIVPMLSAVPEHMKRGPIGHPPAMFSVPSSLTLALEDARAWRMVWSQAGPARRVLEVALAPIRVVWTVLRTSVALPWELAWMVLGAAGRVVAAVLVVGVWPVLKGVWWVVDLPLRAFGAAFAASERGYVRVLRGTLRARWMVAVGVVAGVAWTVDAWQNLGVQLMPDLHQGELQVVLKMPVGTPIDETARVAEGLEAALSGVPDVERTAAFVGRRVDDLDASEQGDHYAEVTVLVSGSAAPAELEASAEAAIVAWAGRQPGLSTTIGRPTLFSAESPLRVEVSGHDLSAIRSTALEVLGVARSVEGLQNPRSTVGVGYPELHLRFDRVRVSRLGLNVRELAEELRARVQGSTASELRSDGLGIDIDVALDRSDVSSIDALSGITVARVGQTSAGGLLTGQSEAARTVTLGQVADFSVGAGPAEIRRIDGQRSAVVLGQSGLLDLGRVASALESGVARLSLPPGVVARVTGQAGELVAAQKAMFFALLLAVFLVYVVMASTFESFVGPLVILVTIPLAFAGVALALEVTATPISVIVFIGVIVLVGIVVNNAIVLVDAVNQHRAGGGGLETAILEACATRLRPVLITAATTVIGLVPMVLATGEGAEIRRPLGLVVASGLGMSTLLTLLVVPAIYRIVFAGGARETSP